MISATDFRKGKRFDHRSTVMLEDDHSEYFSYAQMYNFSGDGMYFESDVSFRPGTQLTIKLDRPIFRAASKNYHAKVQWCKQIGDTSLQYSYGIGVKFI
ncbi:MAG: PilZ domain-containing protein [Desulfobacterales bacterium]|nr:MAG: PilZ domain-containing protein [Desulfobacterales bacterium]